jgi:hypothetical protein
MPAAIATTMNRSLMLDATIHRIMADAIPS